MQRVVIAAAVAACAAVSAAAAISNRPLAAPSNGVAGRPDARALPHSFRLLIGDCIWRPPSPTAAVGAVRYFFGMGATMGGGEEFVRNFHVALKGQYLAAGLSDEEAGREVLAFDQCVASYVPDDGQR
jgi:hypothetical protein